MRNKRRCVCIFAGTSEGREFTHSFMRRAAHIKTGTSIAVRVYTATLYGAALLGFTPSNDDGVTVEICPGRLDEAALCAEFERYRPQLIIDCTHPHALVISKNLKAAAAQTGTGYIRVNRAETPVLPDSGADNIVWVENLAEAAVRLAGRGGNILLTTGSKELAPFSDALFCGRVFVRVLPVEESIAQCRAYGFSPAHIIAMQGPFSETLNIALLREINALYLVTKESGKMGGFDEKISAAAKTGAQAVVVRRPQKESEYLDMEAALDSVFKLFAENE